MREDEVPHGDLWRTDTEKETEQLETRRKTKKDRDGGEENMT